MSIFRKNEPEPTGVWRQCHECGNRFQLQRAGSKSAWCSLSCENSALRRQRDQVETTWIRATWFLR